MITRNYLFILKRKWQTGENGWGTGQIFTLQTGFVIGKVAVQLSQSNMSCAYCLKASHSVRLNGKG